MWGADEGPGCLDSPGVCHLHAFDPRLYVGNEVAAAHGDFDVVVSTVCPRGRDGVAALQLTTHAVMFADGQGRESDEAAELARQCILRAAALVEAAVASGKTVLVHCAWGQNRSCAICCAFAVLYRGFGADEAIAYVRERNLAERSYRGQQPPRGGAMHNAVFCELVARIERDRAALIEPKEPPARSELPQESSAPA
ncbi:hypothetical protein AB1Y20_005709 [Prymnesium parvum]|uniref:Tyrosine specific protein phosphatases domain-containing protein n=1 Tax=Prymnesium parvum TaxID=97485 RepID=A0AB34J3Q5_PRYPA